MPCKTKASPEEMLDQIASYLYQGCLLYTSFYIRALNQSSTEELHLIRRLRRHLLLPEQG